VSGLEALAPLSRQGTADVIADRLREHILGGGFAPGEQVNEVRLAASLQVSRGPVREAVQRLVQEGLLVPARNRGTSVVRLGPEDVADIYRARMAVEREAARVVLAGDPAALADSLDDIVKSMTEAVATGPWPAVARTDLSFHKTIVDAAGSPRLARMFSTLVAESLLCINRFEHLFNPLDEVVAQHQRLADLLRSGDVDAYLAEIDWHLGNSVVRLTEQDEQDGQD
jgi:DNA-binding GntR family transcriptional regulator